MTGSGPAPRLMTEVTEPHAHRARRGSNWDLAGHDGAARRCTKRYRRAVRRLCRCGLNRDHVLGSGRCCYASMQALGTIGPHPPTHWQRDGASLARDPLGPGSLGTTPSHGPRAGRAAVGGGSEELRASVRDSEARLSGPTHLRMCIRVSAQAGPARPRCCGPARGPWAASGPEEAPRSSATRSGSFASSRRRMASHAHLGTTGRETSWAREVWGPRRHRGPRAGGCGQEELRDSSCESERTGADLYISAPPGRRRRPRRHRWHRTRKRTVGPAWSSSEPEELLDSEREAAGSYVIERSSI